METLQTKANTQFMNWWKALNTEMAKRNENEVRYGPARDHYWLGHSPETAAQEEVVQREYEREADIN